MINILGKKFLTVITAGASFLTMNVSATDAPVSTCAMGGACCKDDASKWSLELGSGTLFGNVRDSHLDSYTLVPVVLSLSRSFDKIHLNDFWGGRLRGQVEGVLDGYYTRVASGNENYITGFHFGARYNFVQPGWKLVPFTESTVGAAFTDAHQYVQNGDVHGLGQDFNFNFTVGTGVRYDFTEKFFGRLTLQYTHYSNGGLSEPAHQNKAVDVAGPILSLGMRF